MNIEKLKLIHIGWGNDGDRTYEPIPIEELAGKINELVEAVNEMKNLVTRVEALKKDTSDWNEDKVHFNQGVQAALDEITKL